MTQSFGEKAVGLTSGDDAVANCKKEFAVVIDRMNAIRAVSESVEVCRMATIAIDNIQTSQMWAVKALTWKD